MIQECRFITLIQEMVFKLKCWHITEFHNEELTFMSKLWFILLHLTYSPMPMSVYTEGSPIFSPRHALLNPWTQPSRDLLDMSGRLMRGHMPREATCSFPGPQNTSGGVKKTVFANKKYALPTPPSLRTCLGRIGRHFRFCLEVLLYPIYGLYYGQRSLKWFYFFVDGGVNLKKMGWNM